MKEKILQLLKQASGYVSGEAISTGLGISRNAVWKHIRTLREEGYGISSVTNKGYRLDSVPDILSQAEITDGLSTKRIGQHIYYYEETDSTNNRAKQEADVAPDGSAFLAEIQTGGKGRLGRNWSSSPGVGVWTSILLKPDLPPASTVQITLLAGLAVCRTVRALSGAQALIKWPNDVVAEGKKICGILTEMSAEMERVNYIVCGIGINVNTPSFSEDLQSRAASLYTLTGKTYDRKQVARRLFEEFEALYDQFLQDGAEAVLPAYKEYCVTLGKEVSVLSNNETIPGKAIDITPDGCLTVETANGRITVNAGEVSVRGIYGYI